MSDSVAVDLLIQDFVLTNRIMNRHIGWDELVNRQFLEDGLVKVFGYIRQSQSDQTLYAIGRHIALPDSDWFRIELTLPKLPAIEHRFDCLRMTKQYSHTELTVDSDSNAILVKLVTRHKGLINVVFVIREASSRNLNLNPFLVSDNS